MAANKKIPARTVPQAPALGPEAMRFIEGEQPSEPTSAPKSQSAQPLKRPRVKEATPRNVIERVDGRRLRKIQIYFEVDTATRMRRHCAGEDIDMSAYVSALVEKDLNRLGC